MSVIKVLLAEKKMTTQQLAEKSGISKRTLDPYIAGKSEWKNARGHVLLAVADALNIDPHVLVEGKVKIELK